MRKFILLGLILLLLIIQICRIGNKQLGNLNKFEYENYIKGLSSYPINESLCKTISTLEVVAKKNFL